MITLVDSDVFFDIFTDDPTWHDWSARHLAAAIDHGPLVINPIIWSELSIGFERIEDLEMMLPASTYVREDLPWDAAFLAGKAFLHYRRNQGSRRSPLPDFYIGAHAAVRGYRLLTRDKGRYSTYFPQLEITAP